MNRLAIKSTLLDDCAKFAQENPITIYGAPGDELPDDIIDAILDGKTDKAQESMFDVECNMQCYEHYNPEREQFEQWVKDNDLELSEEEETELYETYSGNITRDYSDFWNTCFNNTRVNIAVTLLDDNGEVVYGPCFENGEEENKVIQDYLFEKTGDSGEKAELCYSSECLKVFGTYDLKTLFEKGLPKKIKIGPNDADNLLFHGSWNGSGSLGSFKPTKEAVFDCKLRNDKSHKYGIDAVYGFVGSVWSHELDFVFEESQCNTP